MFEIPRIKGASSLLLPFHFRWWRIAVGKSPLHWTGFAKSFEVDCIHQGQPNTCVKLSFRNQILNLLFRFLRCEVDTWIFLPSVELWSSAHLCFLSLPDSWQVQCSNCSANRTGFACKLCIISESFVEINRESIVCFITAFILKVLRRDLRLLYQYINIIVSRTSRQLYRESQALRGHRCRLASSSTVPDVPGIYDFLLHFNKLFNPNRTTEKNVSTGWLQF